MGFLGQAFFTARFLVQWLASEKKARVDRPRRVLVAQPSRGYCAPLLCDFPPGPGDHHRPGNGSLCLCAQPDASRARPEHDSLIQRASTHSNALDSRPQASDPESTHGEPDVRSSHERFADEHRSNSSSFESFNVCSCADAALADQHNTGGNPIAKPQSVLEVGVEATLRSRLLIPIKSAPECEHAVQIGRRRETRPKPPFPASCLSQKPHKLQSSRISAIRRMASAPAAAGFDDLIFIDQKIFA